MCGKLYLPEPYVYITPRMERHALIEYMSHQTVVVRSWEWKPLLWYLHHLEAVAYGK